MSGMTIAPAVTAQLHSSMPVHEVLWRCENDETVEKAHKWFTASMGGIIACLTFRIAERSPVMNTWGAIAFFQVAILTTFVQPTRCYPQLRITAPSLSLNQTAIKEAACAVFAQSPSLPRIAVVHPFNLTMSPTECSKT